MGITEQQAEGFVLYPNPAISSNTITLQLPAVTGNVQVTITGVDGKTVYNESFANRRQIAMAVDGIEGGTYVVTVITGTQRMQQRLVIVR